MKKALNFKFSRLRAELSVIVAAAIVLSMACVASFGASAATENAVLTLKGGPEYTFAGNAWNPQLTVETEELAVSEDVSTLKFDIKIPDYETLKPLMKAGSLSTVGGGSWGYGADTDLGIYFEGVSVKGIGVVQRDLFAAFEANAEALSAGETVSLTLPISGTFSAESVISGVNIMVTHGDDTAPAFADKAISLSNFVLNPVVEEEVSQNVLTLKEGPDYKFTGNNWDPQLVVGTEEFTVSAEYKEIRIDFSIPDIETLRPKMSAGSRSSVGGGEFSYGADTDLGLYFGGENVTGVGVSQAALFNAFDQNKQALAAGETVSVVFPISGDFTVGGKITDLRIMLSHESPASEFEGKDISISYVGFDPPKPEEPAADYPLELKDGPDYKFTANAWDPQLQISAESEVKIRPEVDQITFKIKLADINSIKGYFSAGSRSSVDGGSFTYDPNKDLGIYFMGTNINGVGVSQIELFDVFEKNAEALAAGETVTFSLPIIGTFEEDSKVSGIFMMLAHDSGAANLDGVPVSISDVVLRVSSETQGPIGEDQVEILDGPKYVLTGNAWGPQLVIETSDFTLKNTYKFMQLEMSVSDIGTLLSNFTIGSPSVLGGGSWGYGGDDLGIYFTGENVNGIGIRQTDLSALLTEKRGLLERGETVVLEFPFSGEIEEGAVIKGLNFCMSHDSTAGNLAGIEFNIKKVTFSEESSLPTEIEVDFNAEDIKSLNENETVVDFGRKIIYVIENSTVGNLLDNVELNEEKGFQEMVYYEGSRMSNKGKLIADYDFQYIVVPLEGNQIEFDVIPCAKKAGVIDITSPIADNKNPTENVDDIIFDDTDLDDLDTDVDYNPVTNDGYYDEEMTPGNEQQTVVVPSTSGGTNKVVKQTVTENIALYSTPQLIILIAACFLAGAAIMFIIDLFRFKKIVLFKKK